VDRTLERIFEAFADAVEEGRFDRAEGWLAVARWRVRWLAWERRHDATVGRFRWPDSGGPRPLPRVSER
jgi:hypothetical protein